MQATLYSHHKILGTVNLAVTDGSMGVVSGTLSPTRDYYEYQNVFLKRLSADHKDFRRLNLNLQLENGCFITPWKIWVEAIDGFPDEITVYGLGLSRQIIEDYFETNPPKIFVEEPWYVLSIERKLGLEKELRSEIGEKQSQNNNHPLLDYEFSTFATYGAADDVLFEIAGENKEYNFAVVHLTYKGKLEVSNRWPTTDFYNGFDEFKYFRMFPDKAEWES